jgi:lambda repressor-like predicted transcriptional regulator
VVYGKTKNPHPKMMRVIAKVFGLEPKQIREFALAIEETKSKWLKNP